MAKGQRDWLQWIGEKVIAHKPQHQKGGLDEVSVQDLSGKTADFQKAEEIKADEAATRPTNVTVGKVFFATDTKKLSIGKSATANDWYDIFGVDKTDTDTEKNKLVSNSLAKGWEDTKDALAAGIIVMWTGLLINIPAGWKLCDGTLSTPDLRDKFIYGASAGVNPGGTGGTSSHSHTVDSHTHTLSSHTHSVSGNTGLADVTTEAGGSGIVFATDEHVHAINITSGAPSTANTGSAAPATNSQSHLPPFYRVAFIQKT